jgi:hypothetical protein
MILMVALVGERVVGDGVAIAVSSRTPHTKLRNGR